MQEDAERWEKQSGWLGPQDQRTTQRQAHRVFFRLLCPTVGAGEAGNPEITVTQTALHKACSLCLEHEGRGSLARWNTSRWQLPYSSQAPWKKQGPHPTPVTKIWEGPRRSQVVTRHTPAQGVGGVRDCYGLPTTVSPYPTLQCQWEKDQGGVCISEHLVGTLSNGAPSVPGCQHRQSRVAGLPPPAGSKQALIRQKIWIKASVS